MVRITVGSGAKEKLQQVYETVEKEVLSREGDQKLWAGWRIEQLCGDEELVVFWTDELADNEVEKLIALGDHCERRRFRHVV